MLQLFANFMIKKPRLKVQNLQHKFLGWKWPPRTPFGTFLKIHPFWRRQPSQKQIGLDSHPQIFGSVNCFATKALSFWIFMVWKYLFNESGVTPKSLCHSATKENQRKSTTMNNQSWNHYQVDQYVCGLTRLHKASHLSLLFSPITAASIHLLFT